MAHDDPATLELVRIALANKGDQLILAADGRETLKAFKQWGAADWSFSTSGCQKWEDWTF